MNRTGETSFVERLRESFALKGRDVEEPIDVKLHRPLAAFVAALLHPTPLSPNHVTMGSLAVGALGSCFLYLGFFGASFHQPTAFLLAASFLFGSVILDCADGQLARARGGGSLFGRILDGTVDAFVLVPAYVILGWGLKETFDDGTFWIWLAGIGGFSMWARCLIYDNVKTVYLRNTNPDFDASEDSESLENVERKVKAAREDGRHIEAYILKYYAGYLTVQAKISGDSPDEAATPKTGSEQDRQRYRREHATTMRLASWMGLGTHMFLIYTSIAAAAFFPKSLLALQVVQCTIMMALMALVLWRFRRM